MQSRAGGELGSKLVENLKADNGNIDSMKRGFTLIEIVLVIAIVGVLAAILLPVFSSVRKESRKSACLSNMRQFGLALALYTEDSDDLYPAGGDMYLTHTDQWEGYFDGRYWPVVQTLQPINIVMAPYVQSRELWHCPSDTGLSSSGGNPFDAYLPRTSFYRAFGLSYKYEPMLFLEPHFTSTLEACGIGDHNIHYGPPEIIVFSDASASWHGASEDEGRRNVLMADGHAVTLSEGFYKNLESMGYDLSVPCQ